MDHPQQQQSRDAEQRTALAYCAGCAALLITLVCVAARAGDVVVDQGPPRPDVILVTGFRDFNGEENPSAVAATRLNGTGSITSVVLPVDEAGVSYAAGLVSRGAVAAVVHLGLEDATRDLRVEVAGHNILAGPRGTPNSGNCTTRPVFAGEPCTLATTANLGRLALRPRETWSTSAGDFFCNEVYYRTLRAARRGSVPLVPVAFVHLPSEATRPVDAYLSRLADVVHALAGGVRRDPRRAPLRRRR